MLTRLKVSGFKNLVDVDVRFGAFTCIAGVNSVGKSNLFDAIRFLSALANSKNTLYEAALLVREEKGKTADIRNLFHRVGDYYADKMSFEAEITIPNNSINDVGQKIKSTAIFLKYSLELAYKHHESKRYSGRLEIIKEELIKMNKAATWGRSASESNMQDYEKVIATEFNEGIPRFKIYIGGENFLIMQLDNPSRTVLSTGNHIIESPITILAAQEIMSWQLFQLEPSCLRQPSKIYPYYNKLKTNGSDLAAALYYLVGEIYEQKEDDTISEEEIEASIYAQVSNRLSELIGGIDEVWIDRNDNSQFLTLMVKNRDGTIHPARSLSDGTLRFLALSVLELNPDSPRLLCLEEPENGIHPDRIVTILQLLQDIAVDLEEPIGLDNPLRQVIINTHSTVVVQQVPDDSLLVAESREMVVEGRRFKRACFSYLPDTWRDKENPENRKSRVVSRGKLLGYLNPVSSQDQQHRVIDRPDLKPLIPGN